MHGRIKQLLKVYLYGYLYSSAFDSSKIDACTNKWRTKINLFNLLSGSIKSNNIFFFGNILLRNF